MTSLDCLPTVIRVGSTSHELAAGETLFRQGDKTFAIFKVEHGRLRLTQNTIDNHPLTLHTAKQGDLFAEAALSCFRPDAQNRHRSSGDFRNRRLHDPA